MILRHIRLFVSVVLMSSLVALARAEPPSVESLLKRAQYDDMSISPDGEHLSATVSLEDRTMLVVVRRADMQITGTIDPGKDGHVTGAFWVNNQRVFAASSRKFGMDAGASRLPWLYTIQADGKRGKAFGGSLVDTLVNDDDYMLISECTRTEGLRGCWNQVRRIRADLKGNGKDVIEAPALNADFSVDNAGRVRFASCYDNDDNQSLYVRGADEDSEWKLINDERNTGIELTPFGRAEGDRVFYLRSEHKSGPDSIVEYDFASGARKEVLRHEVGDPVAAITSADGRQTIGAVFGVGVPQSRFWLPEHPDARLERELAALFPDEFSIVLNSTRDGRFHVVRVSSDRDSGRFYLLDRPAGDIKLLNKRRPWLDTKALAPMQPIELTARDGMPLHGYLALPAGTRKALPLVVLPHGGPYFVRDDWEFDLDTQVLATRGYAVLRLNFRGSGGYGRAFADAGLREWGGAMQDDLTDATRWAIDQGYADPKRVCIYGASYGGYAALMGAITEPDLYRCAIGVAGVYDLEVLHKWGDVNNTRWGEKYLERIVGTDRKDLAARSPARRAKEIKAAVMLVHGGRDFRASPEHARAMRKALDDAGIAYEGWFPSYEAHGIEDSANQVEFYQRLLAFLDKHIGAGARP
jgi:dipeptidyl aminopeptidase/acylaminoacyl peptidase